MMGSPRLPLPLLMKYKPDIATEKKRDYSPPIPFQIEDNFSETPAEVVIDYISLFIFLMSLGGCLWILLFYI